MNPIWNYLRSQAGKISHIIGFHWLILIFRDTTQNADNYFGFEILESFTNNRDDFKEAQLREFLEEIKRLEDAEKKRQETIETKALNLLGLTGLLGAFIYIFNQIPEDIPWLTEGIAVLYVLISVSLISTILLAAGAIKIGKYQEVRPALENFWEVKGSKIFVLTERAYTLLSAYISNINELNRKATYVIAAQEWFRNSVILLVFLLVCLGGGYIVKSNNNNNENIIIMVTVTPMPTATPSITLTPSSTPSNTPTPTPVIQPTVTP